MLLDLTFLFLTTTLVSGLGYPKYTTRENIQKSLFCIPDETFNKLTKGLLPEDLEVADRLKLHRIQRHEKRIPEISKFYTQKIMKELLKVEPNRALLVGITKLVNHKEAAFIGHDLEIAAKRELMKVCGRRDWPMFLHNGLYEVIDYGDENSLLLDLVNALLAPDEFYFYTRYNPHLIP